MGEQLLSVEGLNAFYGSAHVLDDVSFDVQNEQPVAVIGRNGMGKTTLCAAIMGLTPRVDRPTFVQDCEARCRVRPAGTPALSLSQR